MSSAIIGYGSKFQIESGDSPGVFTDMGEVFNITPPSSEVEQIDVSHMQSPNRTREYIDGMIEPGECSFEMNYIPGSASDLILIAIRDTAAGTARTRTCRLIYPNNVIDQFEGNLQTYEPNLPNDDKATATVTFKLTGAVTRGSVDSPPAF